MTWLCCRVSGLEEEKGKYGFCRVFRRTTSYMEMKGRVVGNEQNKTQQGLVKSVHGTAGSSGSAGACTCSSRPLSALEGLGDLGSSGCRQEVVIYELGFVTYLAPAPLSPQFFFQVSHSCCQPCGIACSDFHEVPHGCPRPRPKTQLHWAN